MRHLGIFAAFAFILAGSAEARQIASDWPALLTGMPQTRD